MVEKELQIVYKFFKPYAYEPLDSKINTKEFLRTLLMYFHVLLFKLLFVTDPRTKRLDVDVLDYGYK